MKFRKKYEFRPDQADSGVFSKLCPTKKQRLSILKWALYGLLLLALSLVQDVVMSRIQLLGATTDLVSCGILLICMLQPPEPGGIFALIGSTLYYFSGSAPGPQAIALLTVLALLLNIFRHTLLQPGFGSTFLCAAAGLMVYELIIFATGVFVGHTLITRLGIFAVTGLLSLAAMPILYPIAASIGKIGGESWKD